MSNDMQNDPLSRLKSDPVPPASPSARERALAASMVAFDAAQNADAKKLCPRPKDRAGSAVSSP